MCIRDRYNTYLVPLSIENNYSDQVVCEEVEMDATNLILARPWLFNRDALYRGKLNQYIIQVRTDE